ncbi:hypothetical protein H9C73_02525 [Marinobacterium sp. AK62]|uniref:DUF4124 domain-containing protein n=1 Tax=Marinobacterium alkalitolerans TaxID=1542925 RepID=A0ABS3Z7C0_9GAMM|nr:hypothetical protein [Marinobacterium alkalitolerans]MBP0047599.1 hypothetical protein [Marinobacterium alkalitolerans]
MRWILLGSSLMLLPVYSMAEVYSCERDGRRLFQSTPCEVGDAPTGIKPPAAASPGQSERQRREQAERFWGEQAQRRQAARARQNEQAADARRRRLQRRAVEQAVGQGRLLPGMTPSQVKRAWGFPDRQNQKIHGGRQREYWYYVDRKTGHVRTAVFQDEALLRASD